jgi:hypothetical protein
LVPFLRQLHEPIQHCRHIFTMGPHNTVSTFLLDSVWAHTRPSALIPWAASWAHAELLVPFPRQLHQLIQQCRHIFTRQFQEPTLHCRHILSRQPVSPYKSFGTDSLGSCMGPYSTVGTFLHTFTRWPVSPYKTLSTYSLGSCMGPYSTVGTFLLDSCMDPHSNVGTYLLDSP